MKDAKNAARPRGADSAKIILVIETRALCGSGTEDDPCYIKVQYWDVNGGYLGERVTDYAEKG